MRAASTTDQSAEAPSEIVSGRAALTGDPATQAGSTTEAPAAQPFAATIDPVTRAVSTRGSVVEPSVEATARGGLVPLRTIVRAPLGPSLAIAGTPGSGIILSRHAAAVSAPLGGGSSTTGLGLVVALVGAGGMALLRARTLASAAGVDDVGTLTAIGQSAATTFWAGSCYSFGSSGSMKASLAPERISAVTVHGDRARFGVGGVASARGSDTAPALPTTSLHGVASSDDRTMLVAVLLAASAMIGGLFAAVSPYRPKAGRKTR